MFLNQIEGMINKDQFVEQSDMYVNLTSGKLQKITKSRDVACSAKVESECEDDDKCVLRTSSSGKKSCINSQRFRKLEPGKEASYYVMEDPYTDKRFVYRPLCLYHMISGNAGVFERFEINKSGNIVKNEKREITITFPPFGSGVVSAFKAFYYNGYIRDVETRKDKRKVGVQIGLFNHVMSWYDNCFAPLNIPTDAEIYITGISLGGAFANLAAFFLIQKRYKRVHMYAYGSPKVGDSNFSKYMEKSKLVSDSANYAQLNNVVVNDKFYTQYDPVCKFPPNSWSLLGSTGLGHLRFAPNPLMRGMMGGMTFNMVFGCYNTQPDYDMIPGTVTAWRLNNQTPIGGDCANHWNYVHSYTAYDANVFIGALFYSGDEKDYYSYVHTIRDLNLKPCVKDESWS